MYKNYYYVSDEVIKAFPDLEHSKEIDKSYSYVAKIENFEEIENYYNSGKAQNGFFAYEIVDSLVSLDCEGVTYDDEDNEIEISYQFDRKLISEWGFLQGIEMELGLSKEQNIAYVIYKLCKSEGINPIDFVNSLK